MVVGEELERRRGVIIPGRAKLEVRRNFFMVRVEKEWNSLPKTVKGQRSVNGFKNAYDRWQKKRSQASNTNGEGDQETSSSEQRIVLTGMRDL